jgi:hypothetical protein
MKQNKLVIVVLVIITVLFILGLSSDFFRGDDDKDDDKSISKVEKFKDRWLGALDDMMAPFQDSLDSRRLDPKEQCQIDDNTFKLTKNRKKCTIAIARRDGAAAQKAVLSVKPGNVKVWIPYPKDEPCPTATRGSLITLGKFKQSKATIGFAKIKPGKIKPGQAQGGTSQQSLRLDFIYTPAGEDPQKARCEAAGEVKLMVLENGGTLNLVCTGCDNNRSVTVALE